MNRSSDWKRKRLTILGVRFDEWTFQPIYFGSNFEQACALAEDRHAAVWENNRNRAEWIVSYEHPPYALKRPDDPAHFDPHWTLMGDARDAA